MTDTEQDVVDQANAIYAQVGMLVRSLEGLNPQLGHLQDAVEDLQDPTTLRIHEYLGNSMGQAIRRLRSAGHEAHTIAARVSGN